MKWGNNSHCWSIDQDTMKVFRIPMIGKNPNPIKTGSWIQIPPHKYLPSIS